MTAVKSEAWCALKRAERAPLRQEVAAKMPGYTELLCPHCLFFYDCGLPPICRDCGRSTVRKHKEPLVGAEKTLTREQLKRLASHGVAYPWTPWQSLDLIDRLEDTQQERDVLFELLARIKRGKPPDWVEGLIDGYVVLGIGIQRALKRRPGRIPLTVWCPGCARDTEHDVVDYDRGAAKLVQCGCGLVHVPPKEDP